MKAKSSQKTKSSPSTHLKESQPTKGFEVVGLSFPTTSALMAHFKNRENISKSTITQEHFLENCEDIGKLGFDWNMRPQDNDHIQNVLYESIRTRGVLEPIVIAFDLSNPKKPLQVIRGKHRAGAMKLIRKDAISGKITCSKRNQVLPARVIVYENKNEYDKDKSQKWGDAATNIPELIKKDDVFARADYFSSIQN